MLSCNLSFLEQYYFLVLVPSMLLAGPGKSLTGSSICQPTPCSKTRPSPLCPLPRTWPPVCSALLFVRGSQRSLRFNVSGSTASQANSRWKLTRTEVPKWGEGCREGEANWKNLGDVSDLFSHLACSLPSFTQSFENVLRATTLGKEHSRWGNRPQERGRTWEFLRRYGINGYQTVLLKWSFCSGSTISLCLAGAGGVQQPGFYHRLPRPP